MRVTSTGGRAASRAGALMSGHCLQAAPHLAVGELVGNERIWTYADAVAWPRRREVARVAHDAEIDEVLVQMVDVLAHAVLEAAAHGNVVEDGEVLDVLAEADAAGMRADRHAELCRHQQDRQHFVDAAHAATVDLQEADGVGLEELLQGDAVLAALRGSDSARCDC